MDWTELIGWAGLADWLECVLARASLLKLAR